MGFFFHHLRGETKKVIIRLPLGSFRRFQLKSMNYSGLNDFEKNNTLKVAGSEYLESLGFFVGISGVGYELLRNLDSEIPNALLFEL